MTESKEYEHPFPNTMFSFLGAPLSACQNSHRLSCKEEEEEEEEGEKPEINRGSHSGAQLIKKKTPLSQSRSCFLLFVYPDIQNEGKFVRKGERRTERCLSPSTQDNQ
jgi:hypothetical protein